MNHSSSSSHPHSRSGKDQGSGAVLNIFVLIAETLLKLFFEEARPEQVFCTREIQKWQDPAISSLWLSSFLLQSKQAHSSCTAAWGGQQLGGCQIWAGA